MSKYLIYTCDRCGKGIIGPSSHAIAEQSAQLKLWAPGEYRAGPGQRIDFCENCFAKLVTFLEGGAAE